MAVLSGEGVAPAVTIAPDSFDFGDLAAGERSAARTFAVRNEGQAPLALDDVVIVGLDPDQFLLAGEECSDGTLAPGEECLVRVRFAPDSAGAKAATLRVRGDAGSFSAALSGNGSESDSEEFAAGGSAGNAGDPRRGRTRSRHHRFARGAAVISAAHGRAMRRADLKARRFRASAR